MIFRDTQAQLQANNLCRFEKPYSQPFVTPSDINLQGKLPLQGLNDYTIEIKMFDCTGNVFIEDVTDYFRVLFATSIYNFRYFNLQLREFTNDFVGCFTLQVKVFNGTTIVFNKITESYKRLYAEKRCYIEVSEKQWDMFSTGNHSLIINGTTTYSDPSKLPNHFEPQYQQFTQIWYLYFDCDQVNTIGFSNNQAFPLAMPLAGALGGSYTQITLHPIYAVYAIDETGCRLPLSRIESTYNCMDNITGLYYGDPKILLNYPNNDENLKYTNSQWNETELKKQPTEIKREVSFLGRTQKVDYVPTFKYTGLIPFTQWKVDEIESIFSGKRLFIDAVEFISRKGEIFKDDTIRATCNYLLNAEIEKYVITNEFSCVDDCNTLCYYFVINGGLKDQAYYDENGVLIGLLFQDLLDYFNALPDVISVADYATTGLDCDPVAIVKIDSFGFVPSFIYYYEFSPSNRIFVKRDDCLNPDTLCDGMFGMCQPPSNITSTCFNTCYLSNITGVCVPAETTNGEITPNPDWILLSGSISTVDTGGDVVIQFTMENSTIIDVPNITSQLVAILSINIRPTVTKIFENTIEDYLITIYPNGEVYVTSNVVQTPGVKITLTSPTLNYSI